MWDARTLTYVDDEKDRERASNGWSRYGAYVELNEEDFSWDGEPLSAGHFAAVAWRTATMKMDPGYVRERPDIRVEVLRDPEEGLVVSVQVPILQRGPGSAAWHDWWREGSGDYRYHRQPSTLRGRPAVLSSTQILYPAQHWELPEPTVTGGRELAEEAQNVCRFLSAQINREIGHIVAGVLEQ